MMPPIQIIGSGVAGLCAAHAFLERGCAVTLIAASDGIDPACCSWWAGGMLAPWCESESAEPLIFRLGMESLAYWKQHSPSWQQHGSLVVATRRDQADLQQFARRSDGHVPQSQDDMTHLEPDIAARFHNGLFYAEEAHVDPRQTLQSLLSVLREHAQFEVRFNTCLTPAELASVPREGWRIDCRGLAARDQLTDLRGVKGEMLILQSEEIRLHRPIRLLHPRHPIYVVPRDDQRFMVGATMIESDDRQSASARSVMELLSSAYALHTGFADAALLEIGSDVRPAFTDNLPRLRRRGRTVYINGLYRHGFLCAPAMAARAAALVLDGRVDEDTCDENTD